MGPRFDIPRRDCDTRKSYPALCDYLRMGAGRSLAKLHDQYRHQSGTEEPPTRRMRTLKRWSSDHDWQERAADYDEKVDAWKEEQARETMQQGLALAHHRVDKLKRIFDQLEIELQEGALWLDDVKGIGSSEHGSYREVNIRRYNSSMISDLRGLLDDLAKETGGRVQRQDITSRGKAVTSVSVNVVQRREVDTGESDG